MSYLADNGFLHDDDGGREGLRTFQSLKEQLQAADSFFECHIDSPVLVVTESSWDVYDALAAATATYQWLENVTLEV